jgi:O-antigen/teichoic acid export membrane protein
MIKTKNREDLLSSALLMTGATYINYGTGILISLIIARHLGPAQYGQYAYLVWLSGLLVSLFNHGTATTAITYISERLGAQDASGAAAVHGWLKRQRKYSILLVGIVFLLALPWIKPAGWQSQLAFFVCMVLISAVAKSAYIFAISVAKGYGTFSIEAVISNILSIATLIAVGVCAWLDASLLVYAGIFVAVSLLHSVFSWSLLRRAQMLPGNQALDASIDTRIRHHLRWTTLLLLVAVFGSKTVETFLLNRISGAEAVGFFLIAVALTKGGIELLSSGLNSVLMSHMAHAFGARGEAAVNAVLSDNVRYFHFLGLLLAGVGFFWAPPVIALMYGSKFAPAIPVMQILVVAGGLGMTDGVFGARLSTTGSQRTRTLIICAMLVVSVVAAVILIPSYGVVGAAVSSACSTLVGVIVVGLYTSVRSGVGLPYAALLTTTLAAVASALPGAVLVWMLRQHAAWIAAGALFGVLYISASLLLRTWTQQDLAGAARILQRIPVVKHAAGGLQRWGRQP